MQLQRPLLVCPENIHRASLVTIHQVFGLWVCTDASRAITMIKVFSLKQCLGELYEPNTLQMLLIECSIVARWSG